MTITAIYWLAALAWLICVLVRGSFLRGQGDRIRDKHDLWWYVFSWGLYGGLIWPVTLCFGFGFWCGQENP